MSGPAAPDGLTWAGELLVSSFVKEGDGTEFFQLLVRSGDVTCDFSLGPGAPE